MPKPKNDAKQPIGKGKKNSGKRMIQATGGGKKTLALWRSIPKDRRKDIRQNTKRAGGDLTKVVKGIGAQRVARGASRKTGLVVGKSRSERGVAPPGGGFGRGGKPKVGKGTGGTTMAPVKGTRKKLPARTTPKVKDIGKMKSLGGGKPRKMKPTGKVVRRKLPKGKPIPRTPAVPNPGKRAV